MTLQLDVPFLIHFPFVLIVVGLVYSATRHDRWDRIIQETIGWTFRMGGFLVCLGTVLFVLSTWPHLWPFIMIPLAIGMAIYYSYTSPLLKSWREKFITARVPKTTATKP